MKIQANPQDRYIMELSMNEKRVIAHEQAHKSAGGELAGAAHYSYTTGPDGRRYITGGEVSISIPATDDKKEAVRMLERVKAAALAPADPSPQDIRVASSASAKEMRVQAEIAKEQVGNMEQKKGKPVDPLEKNKAINDPNAKGRWFDGQF